MRLLFSLFLLLFIAPIFLLAGTMILRDGPEGAGKMAFEDVASVDERARRGVAVEGRLLRLGSPDEHRSGSFHLFPLVAPDAGTGAAGTVLAEVPVVARIPTAEVPVELFRRPETGSPRLLTSPMEISGRRKRGQEVSGKVARLLFPDDPAPGARKVILIEVGEEPASTGDAVTSLVIGALGLFFGLKMLRTWRRRRREGGAARRGGGGLMPSMDFGGGCAKVAGGAVALLIGIGVVAARVGSKAAPAMDGVARSAARGVDEVASGAAKAVDGAARKAGDAALGTGEFALSNASTLKTAYEIQKELGRPPSERVRLTYTFTRIRESYRRRSPSTFELVSMASEYEITRGVRTESGTERDGPDRGRGEFERLRFEQAPGGGVELHLDSGLAGPGGWVETLGFSVPVDFVEGDWGTLTGGGRAVLRLSEGAAQTYGERQAEIFERIAMSEFVEEGFVAGSVDATPKEVATLTYVIDGDRLEIDCEGPQSYTLRIAFWRR